MISIRTSVQGRAPQVVRAIAGALAPERIKPVVGRAVVNAFRTHLFAANRAKPNALGGTRTNFYANAARSTQFTVIPEGVLVSVAAQGLRQRVVGGTIRPKTKKYLTIPVRAEAHGKRASEFPDLVVIWDRSGRPVGLGRKDPLQVGTRTGGRATGAGSGVVMLFRLARQARQVGDPSVVPGAFEIAAAAQSALNAHVDRAVDRARLGPASGGPAK